MQDDLIGYLMGALEPEEMRRIEARLRTDPALRAQLEQLEAQLEPLEAAATPLEPPCGLADRVLEAVDQRRGAGGAATLGCETAAADGRQGRALDLFFSAVAAGALAALIMPAVWQTRLQARVEGCQDHLRLLGNQLMRYAVRDPRNRIPRLAQEGPEAFAGIYAVRLQDAELLDDPTVLWCPGRREARDGRRPTVPDVRTLFAADPQHLARLQRIGSYAYNLGVFVDDRYDAPRFTGRTGFAYLADQPLDPTGRRWLSHPGRGINVLYEDGHVHLVPFHAAYDGSDPIFLNNHGVREAGVTPEDAALAPSDHPPFLTDSKRVAGGGGR